MIAFDEPTRAALRASLVSTGMEAHRAAQVVTLAFRAANRCQRVIFEIADGACDADLMLSVIEIASQLAGHRMTVIAAHLNSSYGAALNTAAAEVAL